MPKDEKEWREKLTEEQYSILRASSTEPAFSGEYWDCDKDGLYRCAGCSAELFDSKSKFDSGTGWPSFDRMSSDAVGMRSDTQHGMVRTEVYCKKCGGHLGHVFDDGPTETCQRFCINSAALKLDEKSS